MDRTKLSSKIQKNRNIQLKEFMRTQDQKDGLGEGKEALNKIQSNMGMELKYPLIQLENLGRKPQ